MHAHRKVIKAGAEAMGLWVACGSFAASAASRQDGSLDADEVATRALLLGIKDWKKVADRLVAAGLWDVDGELYVFHNWDHYETSEGVNAAKAEKAAKKQKAYRDRKAASGNATGNEPVTRYGNVTGNEKVTPGNAPVTPGNALAGVTPALHAGACALPVPAQPNPPLPSDAGEPAGSSGEVLDMGDLRRLWNENRERVTASTMPVHFDAADAEVLGALPRTHRASQSDLEFVDWLAVEFGAWHAESVKAHGQGATRLTSCWAPKSFSGWYGRKGSPATQNARQEAPARSEPYVHRSDLPLVAPIRKPRVEVLS